MLSTWSCIAKRFNDRRAKDKEKSWLTMNTQWPSIMHNNVFIAFWTIGSMNVATFPFFGFYPFKFTDNVKFKNTVQGLEQTFVSRQPSRCLREHPLFTFIAVVRRRIDSQSVYELDHYRDEHVYVVQILIHFKSSLNQMTYFIDGCPQRVLFGWPWIYRLA